MIHHLRTHHLKAAALLFHDAAVAMLFLIAAYAFGPERWGLSLLMLFPIPGKIIALLHNGRVIFHHCAHHRTDCIGLGITEPL